VEAQSGLTWAKTALVNPCVDLFPVTLQLFYVLAQFLDFCFEVLHAIGIWSKSFIECASQKIRCGLGGVFGCAWILAHSARVSRGLLSLRWLSVVVGLTLVLGGVHVLILLGRVKWLRGVWLLLARGTWTLDVLVFGRWSLGVVFVVVVDVALTVTPRPG